MKVDTYKVKPGLANIALLYIFGVSFTLYPPLAQYAQPFIAVSFTAIFLVVLVNIFLLNRPILNSILFKITIMFTLIYIGWLLVATLHENNMAFALQDSLGFAIYLFVMPVFFIFICFCRLHQHLVNFLIQLCAFISVISVAIVLWYYTSFGSVESESLGQLNLYVKLLGLNWIIDHNGGFLGLYTYTAHFLLLGIGLSFYNYYITHEKKHIYFMLLFGFGVFADGHRALVVSMFLLILFLLPLIKARVSFKRMAFYLCLVVIPLFFTLVINFEWLQDRFNFTTSDASTLERFLQVPALLDKITENPLFGSGFGSFASIIRSTERPFSYEVDFLATIMKLGIVGSVLYFGTYLYMIDAARRLGGDIGYILFCVGISFLFYMGTNGGLAMSSDSAIFHMILFVLISLSLSQKYECNLVKKPLHNKLSTLKYGGCFK